MTHPSQNSLRFDAVWRFIAIDAIQYREAWHMRKIAVMGHQGIGNYFQIRGQLQCIRQLQTVLRPQLRDQNGDGRRVAMVFPSCVSVALICNRLNDRSKIIQHRTGVNTSKSQTSAEQLRIGRIKGTFHLYI